MHHWPEGVWLMVYLVGIGGWLRWCLMVVPSRGGLMICMLGAAGQLHGWLIADVDEMTCMWV